MCITIVQIYRVFYKAHAVTHVSSLGTRFTVYGAKTVFPFARLFRAPLDSGETSQFEEKKGEEKKTMSRRRNIPLAR